MKRITRAMPKETKAKISRKLTGRTLSEHHKRLISERLKRYWSTIPTLAEYNEINGEGDGKEVVL